MTTNTNKFRWGNLYEEREIWRVLTGILSCLVCYCHKVFRITYWQKVRSELKPVDNAEQVLMNLSPEQRKALEQLDVSSNFTISPDIDSNSPELVNVIVEFNQAASKN